MREIFQYPVYNTPSGAKAVEFLKDLSGCHPKYLVYLCDRLFEAYCASPNSSSIRLEDVKRMLETVSVNDAQYDLSLFDPLLREDHDSSETRKKIKRYLISLAKWTYNIDRHDCDAYFRCEDMNAPENLAVRELLIERSVLAIKDHRIHIKVGLFRDYVYRRY